jgi:hypothetical protein
MLKEKTEQVSNAKEVPDIDLDDNVERVQLLLPHEWCERLGEISLERECSEDSIMREALGDYLKKIEKLAEIHTEGKMNDGDLDRIINSCISIFGGFEIDGENGFVSYMEANNFKLKNLASDQWKRVVDKLKIGYERYWVKPTTDDWLERFKEIEPSEEQVEDLRMISEEEFDEQSLEDKEYQ